MCCKEKGDKPLNYIIVELFLPIVQPTGLRQNEKKVREHRDEMRKRKTDIILHRSPTAIRGTERSLRKDLMKDKDKALHRVVLQTLALLSLKQELQGAGLPGTIRVA